MEQWTPRDTPLRRDEVLGVLRAHREDFGRFGVSSLKLFGSVARDEAIERSDVDLLVDFESSPRFRTFMQLRFFLEDLLQAKVDLVTESGLRQRARSAVEEDAIGIA